MNSFKQRKKDVLSKDDKSSIGVWDKKISELCNVINDSGEYYTTSSCSGRIMIIRDEDKKGPGLFEFVSHRAVDLDELMAKIPTIGDFKFKQESMILHIACEDLESAKKMLEMTKDVGLKRSGIISLGKNIIIEVVSTEKIEFSFVLDGRLLVGEEFLRVVVEKANKNLEKGWIKIDKLKNLVGK